MVIMLSELLSYLWLNHDDDVILYGVEFKMDYDNAHYKTLMK